MLVLAALIALPSVLSYGYYGYAYPNQQYWNAETRMGAYGSSFGYAQGMYDYVSPPIALTGLGHQYSVSNVRDAVYPQYPVTHFSNAYRPYYGYPYRSYGNPAWEAYRWGTWNAR